MLAGPALASRALRAPIERIDNAPRQPNLGGGGQIGNGRGQPAPDAQIRGFMSLQDVQPTSLDPASRLPPSMPCSAVAAARAAIGARHFRPGARRRADARDPASGRTRTARSACRDLPRPSWSRRSASCWASSAQRVQFTPDLMPADILGSEVMEESHDGKAPRLPLHPGSDLRPAADGRRDQPREPAHPIGAAAGDAGASRDGGRHPSRLAAAVPCAGDAEPARAGGHISAARGTARSLPHADRRPLSRSQRRAAHPHRDDRRSRAEAEARHEADELMAVQRLVRGVCRSATASSMLFSIWSRRARPGEGDAEIVKHVAWGPGPRAAQALMLAVRARACSMAGWRPRSTTWWRWPTPVLKHRMALTFAARADGETVTGLIGRLVSRLG